MQSGIISFLFIWACVGVEGANEREARVLIVGAPEYSVAKWDLVDAFFPTIDIRHSRDSSALFNIWGCEPDQSQSLNIQSERPSNISCLAVSTLATDQMTLDEIGDLFDLMQTDDGLAVVELGEATVQLRALLGKNSACWGIGVSDIATPNRVYLCGEVHPNHLSPLGIFNVQNIWKNPEPMETEMTFWPCIFASAAKSEKKQQKPSVDDDEEKVELEGGEEEEKKIPKESLSTKFHCKYRKSCYESGVLPEIRNDWEWGFSSPRPAPNDPTEETEEETDNIALRKLKCKYRKACYATIGLQQEKKEEDPEEKLSFFSGKISAPQGKKKTVKEIAEKTLQKVKEREDEAKDRELPNSVKVEKKLEAIEKENNRKVSCKYRKSCYETGQLPKMESSSWELPSVFSMIGSMKVTEPKEEVNLDELSDVERKFRCKYRKSCFETGVLPEIAVSSFGDFDFGLDYLSGSQRKADKNEEQEIVDDPSQTLQIRCKYRLSCYDTGILPDLTPQEPVSAKNEAESTMPTSATALKAFCKYRKSCYEKIALSDGLSAVKEIRKERSAEQVPTSGRRRVLDEASLKRRQSRREKLAARREARMVKRTIEGKITGHETPKQQRDRIMAEKEKVEKEVQHKNKHYEREPSKKAVVEESLKQDEPEEEIEAHPVKEEPPRKKSKKSKEKIEVEPEIVEEETPKKKSKKSKEKIDAEVKADEGAPQKKVKKSKEKIEPAPEVETEEQPEHEPKVKTSKAKKPQEPTEEAIDEKPKKKKKVEKTEEDIEPKVVVTKPSKKEQKKEEPAKETKKEVEPAVKEALGLNTALFETLEQQRMTCKYRKSCYSSGKVPELDRTYLDLLDDFNRHVEKQYETDIQKHLKDEDKKLACKYRKSCYETGRLNLIREELPKPTIQPVETSFLKGLSIQQQCKYRKSCYEKHGLKTEDVDKDEMPIKKSEKELEKSKTKVPAEKPKASPPLSSDEKKKDKKKKDDKEKHEESESAEEIDENLKKEIGSLTALQKQKCKYRISCYSGVEPPKASKVESKEAEKAAPKKPISVPKPPPGVKPREHCHQYWFSCREWLGLPPKEKAPIGPNGKRLCKKKKREE